MDKIPLAEYMESVGLKDGRLYKIEHTINFNFIQRTQKIVIFHLRDNVSRPKSFVIMESTYDNKKEIVFIDDTYIINDNQELLKLELL